MSAMSVCGTVRKKLNVASFAALGEQRQRVGTRQHSTYVVRLNKVEIRFYFWNNLRESLLCSEMSFLSLYGRMSFGFCDRVIL
jgi:hypothetical protein